MKIFFGQIYACPTATFNFSIRFQQYLSATFSDLLIPSPQFVAQYGEDWSLMIRISAKHATADTEIRGPSRFRTMRTVEYSCFLPFDPIALEPQPHQAALSFLIEAACTVLSKLSIATDRVQAEKASIIRTVCSSSEMFDATRSRPQDGDA